MRIVQVIATLEPGGAEHQMLALTEGLSARGHEVDVVALTRGGPLERRAWQIAASVHVIGKAWRADPRPLVRLARLLEKLAPDVVHTHMFTANAYGRAAALLAGVPRIVATEHGVGVDRTPLHRLVDALLARRSSLTCPTFALAREVARYGVPGARIAVIPNAVDVDAVRARAGLEGDASPAPVGAEGPGTPLLFAGRLDPAKDIGCLIAAVGILWRRGTRVRLRIAGDGPERARVEAAVARLEPGPREAIELLGHRGDVPAWLARSAILCLPSRTEGLPLVVLEAMAVGLPVVATAIPGLAEAVVHGGTGLLVPPRDPARLADAIASLAGDRARRARLGRAGLERARARFAIGPVARALERVYAPEPSRNTP